MHRPAAPQRSPWAHARAAGEAAAALAAPASFRPYLHTVPPAFRQFSQLLWMAGVRKQFGAANFAAGLSTIAVGRAGAALEDSELTAALRLAEHLANALQQVWAGGSGGCRSGNLLRWAVCFCFCGGGGGGGVGGGGRWGAEGAGCSCLPTWLLLQAPRP
jgi:hypothetical protein